MIRWNIPRSKYHNQKTVIDGIKFDSKKEANRYCELKILERCKNITCLKLQPEYVLQEQFKHNGKNIRQIKYIADFEYYNLTGQVVVEDVKASKTFTTEVYKLKKKLFFKKNPDILFKEIY